MSTDVDMQSLFEYSITIMPKHTKRRRKSKRRGVTAEDV